MTLIFVAFVLIGFIARFLACFPLTFNAMAVAWGSWLAAATIWTIGQVG